MTDEQPIASSGVEALIEKLRNEGVVAGQEKAEDIVNNAQKRAEWIIEEAELEAKILIEQARKEADDLRAAGQDALQLAARDAFLKLRDTLLGSFSKEVMRVVGEQMVDKSFTEQLILALAGAVREKSGIDESKNIVISLPEGVIGVEELRNNPEELKQGNLTHYTASIAANLLRAGVSFEVSNDIKAGLSVRLVDDAMVIDFTDETVAALLLEHIQPRFRALLQGIVK
ncbi:MAG: DivIVA domain-containing protein [Methylococcaceae bacterium]|nr:DivIVA domain-containing protein [Methylococcaceae bacterium]